MYKLFIDESGKNTLKNIKDFDPHFSIGGILVHENSSDFIKKRGDQIKFKYWGRTDITFRGNSIRRFDDDFDIFKDDQNLRDCFYKDLINYIQTSSVRFIWVCCNKNKWISDRPELCHAISNGWRKIITSSEKKLTKSLFEELLRIYVCFLNRKKKHGQIIIEASDISQDGDILAIYNEFMFRGISSLNMNSVDVRNKLTSISFATKNNRDHETQLADIGSHFLNLDARKMDGVNLREITDFEKEIINVFKSKSFFDSCSALNSKSIKRL